MLTLIGRRRTERPRRTAEIDGLSDQLLMAMLGRVDRAGDTEMAHLGIGKDLIDGVNRATGDAGGVEAIDPFGGRTGARDFLDSGIEAISIVQASASIGVIGIRGEMFGAEGLA